MSIFTDAAKWVAHLFSKVKKVLSSGKDIANDIKAITDSPLLDVVVNLTATDLDNKGLKYLREGLATFIKAMGWADKVITEFDADVDARTGALTLLNAKAAKLVAEYKKVDLTMQQAIVAAPIMYDEKTVLV